MPVSQIQNDISSEKVPSVLTSDISPHLLENGAPSSYLNVKVNRDNPITLLNDSYKGNINTTEVRSQGHSETQAGSFTGNVDVNQQNMGASLNDGKNWNAEKCSSPRGTLEKAINQKITTNESRVMSNYDLNNSLTLNDGRESIELMVSLGSAGNTDEASSCNNKNNTNLPREKNAENHKDINSSFDNINSKLIVPREASNEDTSSIVEAGESGTDIKSDENSYKILIKLPSKSKNKNNNSDDFHDISRIEETPEKRQFKSPTKTLEKQYSFMKDDIVTENQLRGTRGVDDNGKTLKEQNKGCIQLENITPKIIISNNSVPFDTSIPKETSEVTLGPQKVSKSMNTEGVSRGIFTKAISISSYHPPPPMRNHHAPAINVSERRKSGSLLSSSNSL